MLNNQRVQVSKNSMVEAKFLTAHPQQNRCSNPQVDHEISRNPQLSFNHVEFPSFQFFKHQNPMKIHGNPPFFPWKHQAHVAPRRQSLWPEQCGAALCLVTTAHKRDDLENHSCSYEKSIHCFSFNSIKFSHSFNRFSCDWCDWMLLPCFLITSFPQ